jgi:hypothetical protein
MSDSSRRIPRRWRLLILIAALLSPAAQAPAAGAAQLLTGVSNIDSSQPLAFKRTRGSGAQLVRIPLEWDETAPQTRPSGWNPDDPSSPGYDWSESDAEVTGATRAGLTPLLQVDNAPQWAQRCESPSTLPSAICDPDPAALADFATAAARRYSGGVAGLPRVRYWQGLNEPNLSLFFFPQFDTAGRALSPGLYRDLINSFYAGVKSVHASNLVLAAGLGPIAVPSYTIGPMRFARDLLCMKGRKHPHPAPGNCGGGVHFDIFAIHPYTTGGPSHRGGRDDVELGDLGKLRALLKAADRAKRIKGAHRHTPLWITEFSWDSKPPDPGGLPMGILNRWTAEALHTAWSAGVSHFFWFSLRDEAHTPGAPYSQTLESGLFFRGPTLAQDRPKKVRKAFRFPFVATPGKGGLAVWGRTPTGRGGKVVIEALRGDWRRLAVRRAGKHGVFRATLGTDYGRGKHGKVRARFKGERSVPFSMRPVRDFHQPPFG